jgi:light-regulated signal transduction histidine kinase (bacteriophytochrome)
MNGQIQLNRDPSAMIQSQGWMLVCDRNGVFVRRRSANAEEIFPALKGEVVNLAEAVGAEAAHALRNAMAKAGACSVLVPRLRAGGALVDAAIHRTPGEIIIEFEIAGRDSPPSPVDMARLIIDRLSSLDAPEKAQKLLTATARLLSAGLQFDSVAIVQCDGILRARHGIDNEAGEMAALRRLMAGHLDRSRTIHDVDAAMNALLSSGSLNDAPLDLSCALLRGISEAERASLRELGAKACLLLPLPMEGGAWGLVACLNRTAALPSLELRAVAELVVAFLSLHLRIALSPPAPAIRTGCFARAMAKTRRRTKNERLMIALD